MARIPYVDRFDDPDVAEAVAMIEGRRGRKILNLDRLLLHNPSIAVGWRHLFTGIRQQSTLDDRIRELVITQVAVINGADYEYRAHAPLALEAGATQAQIDALADWRASDLFDARERAALAYCESMTREVHVPDAIFAEVARHFGTREIVELTAAIAGYNMVSRFLEALQIDPQT
ncbi:MAG: carboxymuconolactone decarboxylase family protein [Chloroflexi bacterium]|nr:carboxymuconolactone decarboxylase family protein [Chloroflexota bacterium]